MLAIRMRRVGAVKQPFYRVVVTESTNPRDGSFVEIVGHYNPRATPSSVNVDRARVDYWVSKGARMSDTVRTLLARHVAPAAEAAPAAAPAAE